jgi:Cu/Zn superoxide dismutase
MNRTLAAIALAGCPHRTPPADQSVPEVVRPPPPAPRVTEAPPPVLVMESMVAIVSGTRSHPDVHGVVQVSTSGADIAVMARIIGLPAGPHGVQMHVYGDCSDPEHGSTGPALDLSTVGREIPSPPPADPVQILPIGIGPVITHPLDPPPDPSSTPGGTTASGPTTDPGHDRPAEGDPGGIAGNLGELDPDAKGVGTLERRLPVPAGAFGALTGRSVVVLAGPSEDPARDPAAEPTVIACGVVGAEPGDQGASGASGPSGEDGTSSGGERVHEIR